MNMKVEKRNKSLVDFDASKIKRAIEKAMAETIDGVDSVLSEEIAHKIEVAFEQDKDIKTHTNIYAGYARAESALLDDLSFAILTVKQV